MAKTPRTLGQVNGHRAQFIPIHRQDNDTPVAATMVLAIPMSVEDVTAALMSITDGMSRKELSEVLGDDNVVRELAMETVFGLGGFGLERARLDLAKVKPNSWDAVRLTLVRDCAADLFGGRTRGRIPAPRKPKGVR
ncbi:hypothetical protein [Amycolatopsis sp. NPDC102389]|uniref:hypothetical protein n=1 Tax=Amycolatopsis sp. NPDC102389 TaxID=3363941 RepID=UPI0037FDA2D7